MKNKPIFFILVSLFVMIFNTSCSAGELSLSNARMAATSDGTDVVKTYSPTDIFFVVADLANAPVGTRVDAKWGALPAEGVEPEIINESYFVNEEDNFTGTIYFQLSTDLGWPTGNYQVQLYLDGTLMNTVAFTVE